MAHPRFLLQPGQTILFEGDSMTALRSGPTLDQWPWLRISNNHRSWADVFSELVFAWRPDLRLTFRTGAVGGSTCRDMETRFEATTARLRPAWTFVTLGSNDATQEIPLAEFEERLERFAKKTAEWGGQVVFLVGLKACPGANESTVAKESSRLPYYAVEERLAERHGNVHVLDIGTSMLEKANQLYAQYEGHAVYSDGCHFSHLGGMIVAGEVLKACGIIA